MSTTWAPMDGQWTINSDLVRFHGGTRKYGDSEEGAQYGIALSNQWFAGGTIRAKVTFSEISAKSVCDIVFWYHTERRQFVSAGLASDVLYGIRQFDTKWTTHTMVGDGANLEARREYSLELRLQGSRASLSVDGIVVTSVTLPFTLSPSQVGLWCRDLSAIEIRDFVVLSEVANVFVVMEFASPFNELHHEVLKSVCSDFGLNAVRADETYGPGLIIADIEKQIDEAKFVIAEITPSNPNVYYEVGYARAKKKPVILLADLSVEKLPFDVSPFRTLFYENSIAGKSRLEDGLRRHILAVLTQSSI